MMCETSIRRRLHQTNTRDGIATLLINCVWIRIEIESRINSCISQYKWGLHWHRRWNIRDMLSTEDAEDIEEALDDSREWNGGCSASTSISTSIGDDALESKSTSKDGNGMHFSCFTDFWIELNYSNLGFQMRNLNIPNENPPRLIQHRIYV